MRRMGFECVRSRARDTNLIIPSILEPCRLFSDLVQEPEALFLAASAFLDHTCELVYFSSDADHGGGKDGIEFTEVTYGAGEVEGEGVEGMGIL